jgi:hypothetical protein
MFRREDWRDKLYLTPGDVGTGMERGREKERRGGGEETREGMDSVRGRG